ncbi:MAG: hypothetical protein KIS78_03065 [Labilithrix sp.]|nr:hypothetical protein [Labilithrix sp.]
MKHELEIAHHHPGRLRMRTAAFVDSLPAAERTRVGLARTRGVRSTAHDPRTGSLLVEYEPRAVDANQLIRCACELSGLELTARAEPRSSAARHVVDFVREVDRRAESLTGGRLDLGVLIPGGLVALGVYSFFKSSHARLPRWDSLVYWSYSIFVHAHARATREAP